MNSPGDHPPRQTSAAIWLIVVSVICCGGTALLALVGGTSLVGVGLVRASIWLLIAGFAIIAAALFWRSQR